MKTKISEQGFTLIEVMVASSLAIGLSLVIMTLVMQAQQMSIVMVSKSQLNAEARLIFDMLGTGQAVDGIDEITKNNIIDDAEQMAGIREGSSIGSNPIILSSVHSDPTTPIEIDSSTEVNISNADGVDNYRLIITKSSNSQTRKSSEVTNTNVPCRTNGSTANPADPLKGGTLVGDPYYDCSSTNSILTSHGYVSYIIVDPTNRSLNNKTVDVEYTLVDPRLAGWRDQLYTTSDYRETYRTSFLMNTN
ncbi:hypothetical protein CCP3SC5AM1_1250003 [Gammaproteobacteria bacterium]